MSKFRRRSPQAVSKAVHYKVNIYVPIMNRKLMEELDIGRQAHLRRIAELNCRLDNLESKGCADSILTDYYDGLDDLYVSQKYLAISSTLITLAVILIIGVISNAP